MIAWVDHVKPYINHYGYWAIIFGVFFESLGLPLPGETLIIVAGIVAAQGVLSLSWIVLLAILATFIANNISYTIGYYGGHLVVVKYGKYIFLDEKRFEVLENFVKRHGSKVLVIARFILGMRQFNGFIAGTAMMPFGRFALFNMIGAVLWVCSWTCLAFYLSKNMSTLFIQYYFLIGFLPFIAFVLIILYFSRIK